jgi:hypothetical protein
VRARRDVGVIDDPVKGPAEAQSSTWLRQQASDLEACLLDTEDAVDQLIAQFASEHMADDSSERQPGSDYPESPLAKPAPMDDTATE